MKNAAKMMATGSMIAMLAACGAVEPQAGSYDIEVEVTKSGETLTARVVLLDSLGRIAAEEEVEAFEVAPGLDVDEVLKKIRVEVRVDGPPDFFPEPDQFETTSQTLTNDGWGNFSGQIVRNFPGEMAAEVTISLDTGSDEEVYEMVYLPIHQAVRAGMAAAPEADTDEGMFEMEYLPIHNAERAGLASTTQVDAE